MKVRLKRTHAEANRWLARERDYDVLSIESSGNAMKYRLLSEMSSTPALFDVTLFDIVESSFPPTWKTMRVGLGVVQSPGPWMEPGYWEHFFEGDEDAVRIFEEERRKIVL